MNTVKDFAFIRISQMHIANALELYKAEIFVYYVGSLKPSLKAALYVTDTGFYAVFYEFYLSRGI